MSTTDTSSPSKARAGLREYLRIMRLDHMTKHVFILPGVILAVLLRGIGEAPIVFNLIAGFAAAVAVASANYVINEWLDRGFDAHHPEKSQRAAVQTELDPRVVYTLYAALLVAGLGLAALVNATFLVVAFVFVLAGAVYNVPPLRTKDRAYVDVMSESLNNPLRLTLGWAMVDPNTLPPASVLIAFWFAGAFLMNAKRLAEFRDIVSQLGQSRLALYRRSFAHYTETRLSVANLTYALLCALFLAVFVAKYRIEYVLLFPIVTYLFALYYALSLDFDSVARRPEKLFREPRLMTATLVLGLGFLVTTFVDIPMLERLAEQHFIDVSGQVVGPDDR